MTSDDTELGMLQLVLVVSNAALSAEQQIQIYPSWCVVADEVALDFSNWCRWALESPIAPVLTNEQRSRLIALETRFERMSSLRNAELWTDEALRSHSEWECVRSDARGIMDAFGW